MKKVNISQLLFYCIYHSTFLYTLLLHFLFFSVKISSIFFLFRYVFFLLLNFFFLFHSEFHSSFSFFSIYLPLSTFRGCFSTFSFLRHHSTLSFRPFYLFFYSSSFQSHFFFFFLSLVSILLFQFFWGNFSISSPFQFHSLLSFCLSPNLTYLRYHPLSLSLSLSIIASGKCFFKKHVSGKYHRLPYLMKNLRFTQNLRQSVGVCRY
ncbi:unnamed protein product [Acanthosepion pharaonis]|uniref:Uncharacterized protein n=1 Tax=Acanthosepion pharaonis TaxID=158019 RepID=A0A812D5C2_ACAPH|nr:unnamed protein product [Sepia pharaonis]